MVGQSGHHGSRRPKPSAVALVPGLPAVVIPSGEHRKSRFKVFEFLGEAQRQSVEPLHKQPLGAVEPFNVRSGYRALFTSAYPANAVALRSDHFRRRVDHVCILVLFDYRAVLHIGTECQIDRFRVGRKAIGA